MKTRLDKTMDLIESKKQTTLGEPVPVIEKQQKKKTKPSGPTYWACKNFHVFRQNFLVHRDRLDVGLRCPECNAPAKNKVNEKAYLEYRKGKGRVNIKEYRVKTEREEARRLNRIGDR